MITVHTRKKFLEVIKGCLPDYPVCAELGALNGEFSKEIFKILNPKPLYLIDPYETSIEKYGDGMNNTPVAYSTEEQYQRLVKEMETYTLFDLIYIVRKYSWDAAYDYENNSFDLVYIDASHRYHDVKRDLFDWYCKVKVDGIISGHDYTEHKEFGVIKAVDEFVKENDVEWIVFNKNGGDWALRKK